MKIAILADSHDNQNALRDVRAILDNRGVNTVIHCGDLCSASMLEFLTGLSIQYAFGNSDRDRKGIRTRLSYFGNGSICGEEVHLEMDGLRIVAMHGNHPVRIREYIDLGEIDFLFHGHLHHRRDERVGKTRIVNPGALGSSSVESHSFCILDTETLALEFIELQNTCHSPE